ncbi:MAG: response regulator transcription factor [Nitrospiraceae bacterium]|jgi:DNA-binding NarL/FixJ family response regulator|uniref:response regulator n=1 Tax=Nitrospira cf. moscoviensis SBR1015 TaxID=96242 RepID=UPI000A0E51CA|nr:response regulator transcription factor [Nitrospira cf. moscoviensis SBR1015]MBY0248769.1 response regulator transcription factor [Nitrospiraceae bacterium]OQW37946.1 MAG: DNA-binding response regulator [Nitrospira sp. SG-bin2]
MSHIRIILVEDHGLVRAGMKALLQKIEGTEVVADMGDGLEAVKYVQTDTPDLVLMDIAMPGLNGLDATARILRESPATRVILLSMHANEEYLQQALQVGASGYLLKGAELAELELAIRTVAKGERYLTPAVAKYAIDAYREKTEGPVGPLAKLSMRQREILQLIAEGHTTKDIAQRLNLSVKTVETHRSQLMERLEIHDVPGLVRFAIGVGLVQPYS